MGGHGSVGRSVWPARAALPALALVPLVVALAISALGGGLPIPHNDGWAYSKVAEGFAQDLDFSLVGWNRPGLVGQVLLAAPATVILSDAVVAQHLTVWVLAVLLVLAVYWFFEPVLGALPAALAAAVTGLFPALGLLSTSFMADVPSASLGMLCLVAGARVPAPLPGRAGLAWLAASMVLGLLAALTREQALAAPAAVLLWLALGERGSGRLPVVVVAGTAFVVSFALVELWRHGLPHDSAPELVSTSRASAYELARAGLILGLALIPVTALILPGLRGLRVGVRGAICLSVVGLGLVALLARRLTGRPEEFLPGNYIGGGRAAPYADLGIGTPDPVVPGAVWIFLAAIGAVSLLVAVAVLSASRGGSKAVSEPRLRLAAIFSWLYAAGLALQTLSGQPLFDRYVLPLVPSVAGLCLAATAIRPSRATAVAVVPAMGILLLLGMGITAAGTAYDAARWDAAERLVRDGNRATDVAAGLEWTGWHSREPYRQPPTAVAGSPWVTGFRDSRDCWLVSADPLPPADHVAVGTHRYERLLVASPSRLLVYRDRGPRCASAGRE